jgi:hypothetical protein
MMLRGFRRKLTENYVAFAYAVSTVSATDNPAANVTDRTTSIKTIKRTATPTDLKVFVKLETNHVLALVSMFGVGLGNPFCGCVKDALWSAALVLVELGGILMPARPRGLAWLARRRFQCEFVGLE